MTEELSTTERLILSYVRSHPPEECMLDKITKGTSRSRATVLKYLEILHAKGLIDYKFVGRSKLWSLAQLENGEIPLELSYAGSKFDKQKKSSKWVQNLAELASELHSLKFKEMGLKKSIDSPETLVFTINSYLDIVATNDTFNTFFKGRNLRDLVDPKQMQLIEKNLSSMTLQDLVTIEIDLIEKTGIYRPYELSLQPIVQNNNIIGTTIIGEELSQYKRTKRELETILSITRSLASADDHETVFKEISDGINELMPFKYFYTILRQGQDLVVSYASPENSIEHISDNEIPQKVIFPIQKSLIKKSEIENSTINEFIGRSIEYLETTSSPEGDLYLETLKSDLKDPELGMMLSVPLIDENESMGVFLILTSSSSVSSVNVESVEMVADEFSNYLRLQRLNQEKEEFIKTLMAMNQVSEIINSFNVENAEDEMLEKSVAVTIESLGFEMGCIYLSDENEELALRVHKNLPDQLRKMCVDGMFKDLFSKTLEKQKLVYITSEYEEYDSLEPAVRDNGIKTMIILPIKYGDKILGLLNMGSRKLKPYNKISLDNLSSIGLQLGLALEKSRLAIELEKV